MLDPSHVKPRTRPAGNPLSAPRRYAVGTVPRWKRWSDCAIAAPLLVLSLGYSLTLIVLLRTA